MEKPRVKLDLWRFPTLLLWVAFFVAGLYPDLVYNHIREVGRVATQRAMINSAWMITLAWAGYLGWFTVLRSRESGDGSSPAAAKGIQVILLGLTAFMPLSLENMADYQYIPVPELRWVIFGTIGAKMVAWIYLMVIVLRYYLFSGHAVFANMPTLFPSAREDRQRMTTGSRNDDSNPSTDVPQEPSGLDAGGRNGND